MKILVIQTAFIGDVILATSVLESLHRHHPDWIIDVLVRKGNEPLLSNFPGVRNILIWDKIKQKTKNLLRLIPVIKNEKYDEVINLQRFISTGILTIFSGAKITTGFDKNPLSIFFKNRIEHIIGNTTALHEVERNLTLVAHLGADQFLRPRLYPSSQDFDKVNLYKVLPYLCIAPTSVWFTKQMPEERWIKLIELLKNRNSGDFKIYLLGGPKDFDSCEKIKTASGIPNVVNLAGELSFLETAALMKDALMNYVNDSAPMHIASAMNAKVTVFFCSTVPAFGFGPLSENKNIIEIEEKLSCRPCGLHGYTSCPKEHFRCGKEIPIEKGIISMNFAK